MTRWRTHTTGVTVVRDGLDEMYPWRLAHDPLAHDPLAKGVVYDARYSDGGVAGEGWSEAALVVLPEPTQCPDGLYPRVSYPTGVKAHARGTRDYLIAGPIEGFSGPDRARARAADLLAAALWCEQHAAGESP